MKAIEVKVKNIYGVDRIYPQCETGKTFASLIGSKTLTIENVRKIRTLGYTFNAQSYTYKEITS